MEKYTLVVKMDGQKEKPTMERLLYLLTKDKVVKPNALGQFIAVIEKNFEECPFEKDVIKHRKDFTVLFKDKVEYACQMTEDKDAAQFKDIIFADFIAITTQDSELLIYQNGERYWDEDYIKNKYIPRFTIKQK